MPNIPINRSQLKLVEHKLKKNPNAYLSCLKRHLLPVYPSGDLEKYFKVAQESYEEILSLGDAGFREDGDVADYAINLGDCYQLGIGCEVSFPKALEIYREIHQRGWISAFYRHDDYERPRLFQYIKLLLARFGGEDGAIHGFDLLNEYLADMQDTSNLCHIDLGLCYHYGIGCEKDEEEAMDCIAVYLHQKQNYVMTSRILHTNFFGDYRLDDTQLKALQERGVQGAGLLLEVGYGETIYPAREIDRPTKRLLDEIEASSNAGNYAAIGKTIRYLESHMDPEDYLQSDLIDNWMERGYPMYEELKDPREAIPWLDAELEEQQQHIVQKGQLHNLLSLYRYCRDNSFYLDEESTLLNVPPIDGCLAMLRARETVSDPIDYLAAAFLCDRNEAMDFYLRAFELLNTYPEEEKHRVITRALNLIDQSDLLEQCFRGFPTDERVLRALFPCLYAMSPECMHAYLDSLLSAYSEERYAHQPIAYAIFATREAIRCVENKDPLPSEGFQRLYDEGMLSDGEYDIRRSLEEYDDLLDDLICAPDQMDCNRISHDLRNQCALIQACLEFISPQHENGYLSVAKLLTQVYEPKMIHLLYPWIDVCLLLSNEEGVNQPYKEEGEHYSMFASFIRCIYAGRTLSEHKNADSDDLCDDMGSNIFYDELYNAAIDLGWHLALPFLRQVADRLSTLANAIVSFFNYGIEIPIEALEKPKDRTYYFNILTAYKQSAEFFARKARINARDMVEAGNAIKEFLYGDQDFDTFFKAIAELPIEEWYLCTKLD